MLPPGHSNVDVDRAIEDIIQEGCTGINRSFSANRLSGSIPTAHMEAEVHSVTNPSLSHPPLAAHHSWPIAAAPLTCRGHDVIYAELEWHAYQPAMMCNGKPLIHGGEDSVDYADIDFLRTALQSEQPSIDDGDRQNEESDPINCDDPHVCQ